MIEKNIEALDKEIKKYKKKKKTKEKKEKQEELAWQKKLKSFNAKEAKLLPKKIKLYKNILAWRDKFTKTKQFKKIFNELNECVIFWNGWAHKPTEFGGYGCWSRLYLEKSGKLGYWAGYKWMGGGPRIVLTRKPETSKKFTYNYLEELHNSIKTGKIYETIAKELKEEY